MESSSSETSFTFKVDPVELCQEVPPMKTAEDILRKKIFTKQNPESPLLGAIEFSGKFEDYSHRKDMSVNYIHLNIPGMMAAVHTAYSHHYTLSLSVSDFIILIGQGLGIHINENTGKLRNHFVGHEGKETIKVRRDDFVLGEQNDWSTVFGEFAEGIKKRMKTDVYDVIVDDTSVATPTSRIVSEITLMEAMKNFFDFSAVSCCGIPEITLEGRPEDWQKLKDKVGKLVEMNQDDCLDLKWWLDELLPVVDKICEAGIERQFDREFWGSIYKYQMMSGGDDITGWITKFFPYVCSGLKKERNEFGVIKTNMIPKQVSEVPFIWTYLGKDIPMKFTAGFLGAEWNQDLCQLKPTYFWCVTKNNTAMFDQYTSKELADMIISKLSAKDKENLPSTEGGQS